MSHAPREGRHSFWGNVASGSITHIKSVCVCVPMCMRVCLPAQMMRGYACEQGQSRMFVLKQSEESERPVCPHTARLCDIPVWADRSENGPSGQIGRGSALRFELGCCTVEKKLKITISKQIDF